LAGGRGRPRAIIRHVPLDLAGGAAEDRQTQQAKAALDRLARKSKPVP
jgi:hypothetical protein